MGIDDIILSFVISYLAGSITPLNDLFTGKDGASLHDKLKQCYRNALKRWSANDNVRNRIAQKKYSDICKLQKLYKLTTKEEEAIALKELSALWADELRKDEMCFLSIKSFDLKSLEGKIDRLAELLSNRNQGTISFGLTRHKPVDGYIRRYCSSDKSECNYISYLLGTKERHTLADFVTEVEDIGNNKVILYSSAQTGKTTELKQLCWELQNSGLYMPVLFEVRNNTKLKRSQLPSFSFYEEKKIVVVIDALDEVNGQKYDDLLEEICGYAYDHPEVPIVLSCRSNYRRESQLNQFSELYLEELTGNEAKKHIDQKLGEGNGLLYYIYDNNLRDFAKNPFFLNVLIEAYKEDRNNMPKTKADIYRLFIEKSYNKEKEDKLVLKNRSMHSFQESIRLLERVALALSIMNTQSINGENLLYCLWTEQNLEECLRYDLLRCEDGLYSFKHNAFREWLVANYFSHKGIEKAKQLASHPNGRIKPEWYNIIMLWVSMYGKDRKGDVYEILKWLKAASLDLVVYIDRDMLDEKTRDEVFKGLLLEYKSLGISMVNSSSDDYQNLLDFGYSENTIRFLADEIDNSTIGTNYFADLMYLCYFLNWNRLSLENNELTERLFQSVERKTIEVIGKDEIPDMSFMYLDNQFFAQNEFFHRIYSVVKESNHYGIIKAMILLISEADKVDEKIDYIIDKERYVHSQQDGYTTRVVYRDTIYSTLARVKSFDSIKKVLKHDFRNPISFYDNEFEEYLMMIETVLNKAIPLINQDNKMELADILESIYTKMFAHYDILLDHNPNAKKLLDTLRKSYIEAGLSERGRKQFYEQQNLIFDSQNINAISWNKIQSVYSMAALWMTKKDVEEDFCEFSNNKEHNIGKANWYLNIPFMEVAERANELFYTIFPQADNSAKIRERRQRNLDDFADYSVFKQVVLEMVQELDEHTTRKEYRLKLQKLEKGYNTYAFRFIIDYPLGEDRFDVKSIIHNIKKENVYNAFFMDEIVRLIENPDPYLSISDDLRGRCIAIAEESIKNYCNGQSNILYKSAIRLMMNGSFEISTENLLCLLDYGSFSVSKKDGEHNFSRDYSLFEYISERVGLEELAPILLEKMNQYVENEDYCHLSFLYLDYLINKHVKEAYNLALKFALTGYSMSSNILEELIENKILIEEIKAATKSMSYSDRVYCYSSLFRHTDEAEWVKEKLEEEFNEYRDYTQRRAIYLMTCMGSMVALRYLQNHPDLLLSDDNYNFNYSDPNATPTLCHFIDYCLINKVDGYVILNSIYASLEKIAIQDEDSLHEVKVYLRNLTQKGQQFIHLNRYIIEFEEKYYAANSGISNINEAMAIVDNDTLVSSSDVKEQYEITDTYDGVYISYKWESSSSHIVDYLCFVLESKGIAYQRDKKDCNYRDNIKSFMDAIRKGDTIVVVFSRPYLKSPNCMYELSGIFENENYCSKIIPLVMDDTIRDSLFYVDLVKYWKDKKDKQEEVVLKLRIIDPEMEEPEVEILNNMKAIYRILPKIKDYIQCINTDNIDSLSASHFKSIIDEIKSNKAH